MKQQLPPLSRRNRYFFNIRSSGIPVGLGDGEAVGDVCVELDGDLEGLGPRRPVARHPLAAGWGPIQ